MNRRWEFKDIIENISNCKNIIELLEKLNIENNFVNRRDLEDYIKGTGLRFKS